MNNEFVSYEMALELKELGFDESCFAAYYGKSDISNFKESDHVLCGDRHNTSFQKDGRVSAPLHQQVFRWFREKYGLDSYIMPSRLETRWFREKYDLYSHVRESLGFDNVLEFVCQINGSYVNHGIKDKPK